MVWSLHYLAASAAVLGLALAFAFVTGVRNSSLIVATVVSTRALTPTRAFLMCACFEFLGTVFSGTAVINTIGRNMFGDVFRPGHPDALLVLGSGLGAALLWSSLCYWRALPVSSSNAVFAGLAGASWMAWGPAYLLNGTLLKVFLVLIFSPVAGLVLALALSHLARYLGQWMTPRVTSFAESLHVGGTALVSWADGSNDGQLATALAVLVWGLIQPTGRATLFVPMWIRLTVGGLIALGALMGGRRIVKKLGMSFYRIQTIEGFGSQMSSAGIVLACNVRGFPVSISQVITGSILGAGAAKNVREVRWTLAADVIWSWILTVPAAGALAALLFSLIRLGRTS